VFHALIPCLALVAAEPPPGADRNAIFTFVSWCLAVVAAVTLIWPVNVPLAALAYKLRNGYQPIDLDTGVFWLRSTFAALGLALITLVTLAAAWVLIVQADLPPGVIHLILILAYVPAGVWYLFWMYALEDMVQAFSVFLLYILVAGLPLLLIGWLAGWWVKLAQAAPWLLNS
jgi:hypothetical protein